jgi:hypothetical protein
MAGARRVAWRAGAAAWHASCDKPIRIILSGRFDRCPRST